MINVTPVIICGGSGPRLWRLSRPGFPKQFLCLTGKESLFHKAVLRLANLCSMDIKATSSIIVTGENYRFLVSEQLREVGVGHRFAFLEPLGRNTAPALTLAALAAMEGAADPVLVVTPADQTVLNDAAFTSALQQAVAEAANGSIVILCVTPDKPETGHGYIQTSKSLRGAAEAIQLVQRLVEKPDANTAQTYLNEGGYYWNARIFVLRASVWLKALEQFRPHIFQATKAPWDNRSASNTFVRLGKDEFAAIPSESVDYVAIEHYLCSNFPITMVSLDAGWNDVRAWGVVCNSLPKDEAANEHLGNVLTTESRNTLLHASSGLVSLVGVESLIVAEATDAVMVADKSCSQDVKHIFIQLKETKRGGHTLHRKVHRPRGCYDSLDEGGHFKVKRIQVKPKASLGLQKHHYCAEHWIVVTGTAEITNGNKALTLTENLPTSMPLGKVHRLANPGTKLLEIIEVQSGGYLVEDDIVRCQVNYGR